jgi:hypothetical protein
MRSTISSLLMLFSISFIFLCLIPETRAADTILPAGTLIRCITDEPAFNSKTANVGDPLLCRPRPLFLFGHSVLPRGTYVAGRLESYKDPRNLVGQGYMVIQFDRLGLPNNMELPFSAKITAVNGGSGGYYPVDRDGKILGKGHAKRDIAEWLFPVLWPWKLITLPARGPRPSLKGEVTITLRLMDDTAIPQFEYQPEDARPTLSPRPTVNPSRYIAPLRHTNEGDTSARQRHGRLTIIVLTDGTTYTVSDFRAKPGNVVTFTLPDHTTGVLSRGDIDWEASAKLNHF